MHVWRQRENNTNTFSGICQVVAEPSPLAKWFSPTSKPHGTHDSKPCLGKAWSSSTSLGSIAKCRRHSDIHQCGCAEAPSLPVRRLHPHCCILPPHFSWEREENSSFCPIPGQCLGRRRRLQSILDSLVTSDTVTWLEFTPTLNHCSWKCFYFYNVGESVPQLCYSSSYMVYRFILGNRFPSASLTTKIYLYFSNNFYNEIIKGI